MSVIESNITIDVPDGHDISNIISSIEQTISELTGKKTYINVTEVDDPMSLSSVHGFKELGD